MAKLLEVIDTFSAGNFIKIENFTGIVELLQKLNWNWLSDLFISALTLMVFLILIQLFQFHEAYLKYYKLGKAKFLMTYALFKYFKVINL